MDPKEPKPHVDFINTIIKALVNQPDEVEIEDRTDDRGIFIQVFVAKDDLGRVIGKGGEHATAIRMLLRALGTKNNAHYGFKVDTRSA